MQHNIPRNSSGWSQALEKDVARSSGSQGFSKIWPQNPRKLREFPVLFLCRMIFGNDYRKLSSMKFLWEFIAGM